MGCSHKVAERLQDGSNDYGGSDLFPFYDGLGSTTDLVDGSANVIGTYRYDVFGAIRSQTGSSPNQWLFTGEQRDGDSSLYFLRARYYDPAIGRFLSQDPAKAGHPYVYVENTPTNLTDPDGRCPWCAVAGGIVGGAVGFGRIYVGDFIESASKDHSEAFVPTSSFKTYLVSTIGGAATGAACGATGGAACWGAGKFATSFVDSVLSDGFAVRQPTLKGTENAVVDGVIAGLTEGVVGRGPKVRGRYPSKLTSSRYWFGAHAKNLYVKSGLGSLLDEFGGAPFRGQLNGPAMGASP